MNDNYKKWNEIIGRMIGRNYNFINSTREIMFYRKYKNVKLINIMGSFEQFHFQTEDGELLILPGRYVISILPVKNKEK